MADEHDDDPDSGSLRHVFSEMRAADEDPPARGLAELMAAARAHAPTSVPWWQRIAHALRQPPALAVASIVILIGGALVISRPDATIEEVAPTTRSNAAQTAIPPRGPSTPPQDERRAKAAVTPKDMTPPPRPRATPSAAGESAGLQAPSSENRAVPPSQLGLQQLSEKAALAATRGDCGAAKALATRVAAQDPSYYRDHVASDAAVAKCLN